MRRRIGLVTLAMMLLVLHVHAQVTVSIPTDLTAPPQAGRMQIPVRITDVTDLGIISADLTLAYDTDVLDMVGVSLQGTIAQAGMKSAGIDDAAGEVRIAIIASTPLTGAGVLAYLVCDVIVQTAGETSDLVFAKAHLNAGLVPTLTSDGLLTVTGEPTQTPAIITVSLPDSLSFPPGVTRLAIPISVTDLTELDVISATMRISYDSGVLVGLGASLVETIAEGGLVAALPDDIAGSLELSLIFSTPEQPALKGSGVLIYAQFDVRTDAVNITTPLTITHALFNDDSYATLILDGQVTINAGDRRQQRDVLANTAYELDLFDVTVQIPGDALDIDGQLEVSIPYSTPHLLGGLSGVDRVYDVRFMGNEDLTFREPIHLIFNYRDVDIPAHVAEDSLHVYREQDGLWQYVEGIQDAAEDTIDVALDHFSTYALLGGYGYGDVTGNGEISPFDASLVLQKSVYLIGDLPPPDRPAFFFQTSDVSGNGEISPFDAGMILRKSIHLAPHPNSPDEMRFPIETTLPDAAPALPIKRIDMLSTHTSQSGGWVSMTWSLTEAAQELSPNILSLELVWNYPQNSVQRLSVHPHIQSPSAVTQSSSQPGTLRLGMVSAVGLPSDEPLMTLRWWQGKAIDQQFLRGMRVRLNDVDVPIAGNTLTEVSSFLSSTRLYANYPNPCNPETWIPFTLESTVPVSMRIFDSRGYLVRELELGIREPGAYLTRDRAAHWDGRNHKGERVASGLYTYQLKAGSTTFTRKLVVAK